MPENSGITDQWATDESSIILRTKLYRPKLSPDLITRPELVARLDALRHRPVTLISAGAGYGKSTMTSLWLKAWKGPSAWVSLGEEENDLRLFLGYLLAAIQNAFPKACGKTQSLLNSSPLPPVKILSRYLLNDLDQIKEPFILVLDDYHLIRDKQVHDLMGEFLTYPPRNLHLMLLTRRDPVLLTSVLRGRGQINEIITADLQFTVEETTLFLKNTLNFSIKAKTAVSIHKRLEGWPAGMRLMVQSAKSPSDFDRLLAEFKGSFAGIVDYLATEALGQLSEKMIALLTATAILDRFCAPLCTDLLSGLGPDQSEIDGVSLISTLKKNNLFLIPLDTEHRWYRHHHMFQSLLLRRLKKTCSDQEIASLHILASQWLANNDCIEEALAHAIAANNIAYAVRLLQQHRYDLINRDLWNRLNRWLQMIPHEAVAKRPLLLTAQAFYYESCGLMTEAFAILEKLAPLLSKIPPDSHEFNQAHGEYYTLLAEQQYMSAQPDLAIASSKKALELLPSEARFFRYFAVLWNSLALQMNGDSDQGVQLVQETLNLPSMFQTARPWKRHLCLGLLYKINADLRGVEESALKIYLLSKKQGLQPSMIHGFWYLGTLNYWRNNLPEAITHLQVVIENPYAVRSVYFCMCVYLRALIYLAQGQAEDAEKMIESVISFGLDTDNPMIIELGHSFQVELALRQSRVDKAKRIMKGVNFELYPPLWLNYHSQLTRIKALMAMDTEENDREAETQLDTWYQFGRSTHNTNFLIQVLALQALLFSKQNKEAEALEKLYTSLKLAEPGGFIRTFVDLGTPMADLLSRLQKQNKAVGYIEKLLAAFRDESFQPSISTVPMETDHQGPSLPLPSQPLIEPLTNRELDVLELLAQRLQNKEIAEKLFVANQTIKTHLKSIYQKLDVSNRRKAVEKARRLGIISQP